MNLVQKKHRILSMLKKDLFQILKDTIIAIIITLIIFLFQYLSHFTISLYSKINPNNDSLLMISIYGILMVVFSIIELVIVIYYEKKEDFLDHLTFDLKRVRKRNLIFKIFIVFLTCLLTFFIGLALGEEGPSVLLGSIIGLLIGRLFNKNEEEIKLTNLGASIGFALAFLNPVAGLFKFYKNNKGLKMNIKEYLRAIYSLIISYLLLSLLKGQFLYNLYFNLEENIEGPICLIFLILPFIIFILTFIYKRICKLIRKIIKNNKFINYIVFPIILVVSSFLLRIYYPLLIGSGSNIISLSLLNLSISTLFIYLILRFIFVIFSFTSKFKGGVVLPTVSFGFLIGKIIATIISLYIYKISGNEELIIIIISGCLFYSFTFKEVFVGASLIFSFGNPLILLPPILISSAISYVLINKLPIYSLNDFLNDKFSQKLML